MHGSELGETRGPALHRPSLVTKLGLELVLLVVSCPGRPVGLRARACARRAARHSWTWCGRRGAHAAAHRACRPRRHAATHAAQRLTHGPCRHRLRSGHRPWRCRGRRLHYCRGRWLLRGSGFLRRRAFRCRSRGLPLSCRSLACAGLARSLARRRLPRRAPSRARLARRCSPRGAPPWRGLSRDPARRCPSCSLARARLPSRLARCLPRTHLPHARSSHACALGGLTSRCALLPTRFRSHDLCSSSVRVPHSTVSSDDACTNHASWSNLAVPHGESIVFFHYTLIASENGNCQANLLNCFDNKFLLAKPLRTHSLRLSAFPLSTPPHGTGEPERCRAETRRRHRPSFRCRDRGTGERPALHRLRVPCAGHSCRNVASLIRSANERRTTPAGYTTMRLLLGIILGALLTVGAPFVADSSGRPLSPTL